MSNAIPRLLLLTFSLSAFSTAANALWSQDCKAVIFPSNMTAASANCDMISAEVASLSQFMPPAPFISTMVGFQEAYPNTGLFPSTLPSFAGGVPWGTGNTSSSSTGTSSAVSGGSTSSSSATSSTNSSSSSAPSSWQ